MNKKLKLYTILIISFSMLAWWGVLFFTSTREQQINYYWQVAMGLSALLFAGIGISTAAKWGWFKSGVGRAILFISAGLIMWGLGQLGWSYYLFADPGVEAVPSHIPDYIYFTALPLWFVGILMLSKATGARYGIRKTSGKILVGLIAAIMSLLSYYILVDVARGGIDYFSQPFLDTFFDLGYSIGDAILLTIVFAIFALSWKVLGGRFKRPIVTILIAFVFLFFADFAYSYTNGKGVYFNGNIADLFFFLMVCTFGLGVGMLDPGHVRKKKVSDKPVAQEAPAPAELKAEESPVAPIETTAEADAELVQTPQETPDFLKVNPVAPYANPHDNSEKEN